MKKFLIIIMMSMLLLPKIVKADTSILEINNGVGNNWCGIKNNTYNCTLSYEEAYNLIMEEYNSNYRSQYPYYLLSNIRNAIDGENKLLIGMSTNKSYTFYAELDNFGVGLDDENAMQLTSYYDNEWKISGYGGNGLVININGNGTYGYYESNIDFKISGNNYTLEGFYNTDDIMLEIGDRVPMYNNLIEYNSWSEYLDNNNPDLSTVNLNNYSYVILTLRDYNQTNAFSTNLQVKGSIGITPVYNYGQTSKEEITGVKVQDRCNVSYENYTIYPFYILNQDLQNNVIYIVKSCEENSSFKYDNTIFDITYITNENENNPTVTINGKTYNVIPFDDLPSSANKNEEENYIPGESGNAVDTGGLNGAIKGAKNVLGQIWDTFTYFTGLVNMLFSAMPVELRTILVSAFTITITLGLIKIFLN